MLTFDGNLELSSSEKGFILHEVVDKLGTLGVRLFEFFSIPQKIMILLIFPLEC